MSDSDQLVFEVECASYDSSDTSNEHILRVVASSEEELLSAIGIMAASYRLTETHAPAQDISYRLPQDRDKLQAKMINFMTGHY